MVWSGEAYRTAVRRAGAAGPRASGSRMPEVPAPAPLTGLQIESWRLLRDEWAADAGAQAEWRVWEAGRTRAQPEAAALARELLAGRIDAEAFRATFDRHTRARWDAFGLRGVSGAMFLNRIVKQARATPLAGALDRALRAALAVPPNASGAAAQLAAFTAFVRDLGPGAAPALATAFASAWWHLQDPVAWPGYQLSMRQTLAAEDDVFVPTGDPVADYVAFRAAALALAAALGLHPWALEHLCWWQERRDPTAALAPDRTHHAARVEDDAYDAFGVHDGADARDRPTRDRWGVVVEALGAHRRAPQRALPSGTAVPDTPGPDPAMPDGDTPTHTHAQWLLARLGRRLGCRVWIAANDHHRVWDGERLGACSVDRLPPLGLDPDSQRLVELIDVVWLRGTSQVAAAFEVECTTSVHGGLLRMADLAALAPNLAVPLYVVVPEARLPKVRRELRRPALQALELHRRCGFFSTEALVAAAPEIARWASGPEAIGRLAEWLDAAG